MSNITKEDANERIAKNLDTIQVLLKDCQDLADMYALEFRTPIQKYGMGGYYYGKNHADWKDSDSSEIDSPGRWVSSSEGC